MILEVLPAGRSRCAFVPRYFSRKSLMTMKGTQIGCSFLFKFGPSATFLEVERSNLLPVNKHSDGNPGFHDDLHSWWILHSFSVFTGWYPLISKARILVSSPNLSVGRVPIYSSP